MGSKAVLTDTTVKTINRCVCVYINEAFEVSPLTPPHHAHKQSHAVYTDNSEGTGKKNLVKAGMSQPRCHNNKPISPLLK